MCRERGGVDVQVLAGMGCRLAALSVRWLVVWLDGLPGPWLAVSLPLWPAKLAGWLLAACVSRPPRCCLHCLLGCLAACLHAPPYIAPGARWHACRPISSRSVSTNRLETARERGGW